MLCPVFFLVVLSGRVKRVPWVEVDGRVRRSLSSVLGACTAESVNSVPWSHETSRLDSRVRWITGSRRLLGSRLREHAGYRGVGRGRGAVPEGKETWARHATLQRLSECRAKRGVWPRSVLGRPGGDKRGGTATTPGSHWTWEDRVPFSRGPSSIAFSPWGPGNKRTSCLWLLLLSHLPLPSGHVRWPHPRRGHHRLQPVVGVHSCQIWKVRTDARRPESRAQTLTRGAGGEGRDPRWACPPRCGSGESSELGCVSLQLHPRPHGTHTEAPTSPCSCWRGRDRGVWRAPPWRPLSPGGQRPRAPWW